MNFLYYLLLFVFAGPLIRNLNYYIPGLGFILYIAFIAYVFYSNSKQINQRQSNQRYYSNNTQNYNNSTNSKVKKDVIDVEFREREVE